MMTSNTGPIWLLGYGSLLWNPDFEYEERVVGYIEGYKRRFWLLNETHRGRPGKPGRVVTIVEDPNQRVWGVAYKISHDHINDDLEKLRCREKDYVSTNVSFHPKEGDQQTFNVRLYIAPSDHCNFSQTDNITIAKDIREAVGPSGSNSEYLFKLADYVRENIPEDQDSHLFELEHLVRYGRGDNAGGSVQPINYRNVGNYGFPQQLMQRRME